MGEPNWVLLTVTTEHRRPWLADAEAHQLLHGAWLHARTWLVSDYVLMPDHLHCFAAPHDMGISMEQWITYWKRWFRRGHDHAEWRFQSRGWHHRLRDQEDDSERWKYVQENPVRAGLVTRIGAWPFQGPVHEIRG